MRPVKTMIGTLIISLLFSKLPLERLWGRRPVAEGARCGLEG
jgi:hypothetical protein